MKLNDVIRRTVSVLAAALLLTGTLAGCGEEEGPEQVALRTMSIMGDDGQKQAYTALLESYSAKYPHVYHMGTVAQTSNAYKLNATFEDTYTESRYPHAVYYYTNTGMEELTEYFVSVEEIRQDYPDFAMEITEAAMKDVRAEDGKTYCVPFAGGWTAVAVNNALLERFSLSAPDDWQELLTVCGVLSARGVTPIANPADGSAVLLEQLCVGLGVPDAFSSALSSEEPLAEQEYRQIWLEVFRRYQELCGIRSLPAPSATEELTEAALLMAPASGSDVSSGDVFVADIPQNTMKTNPLDLFNSGGAAMIVIDSSQLTRLAVEDYSLIMFPELPGSGRRIMTGGFTTGWFITRRAYEDKSVRDAVVAFVDSMTDSAAAESFAAIGWLPSAEITAGEEGVGLLDLAERADSFEPSCLSSANTARAAALERIASALYFGLITPEQAVEMAADPSLKLEDVVEKPEPELPENTASDSDLAVSDGDLQTPADAAGAE